MTPGRLVKINDREVSETEAFLRDLADEAPTEDQCWCSPCEHDVTAALIKAADEYAALEQDLRAALQTIRERTDQRDTFGRALRARGLG